MKQEELDHLLLLKDLAAAYESFTGQANANWNARILLTLVALSLSTKCISLRAPAKVYLKRKHPDLWSRLLYYDETLSASMPVQAAVKEAW